MSRKPRTRPNHHEGRSIRVDGRPEPGFYKMRLYSRGPWTPALIWLSPARDPITKQALDRAPALLCMVDGKEACPYEMWTRLHPIEESEYRRLVRERKGVETEDLLNSEVRI